MRFAHGCPDYFALAQKSGLSYIGVVAALQRGRQSLTPPRGSRSGRPPLSLPPSEVDRNLGPASSLLRRALFLFRQRNAGPVSFQLARVFPIGRRLSNGFARRYLRALVGPVAQWLELAAHNGLVAGSSPAGPTIFRMSGQGGQAARRFVAAVSGVFRAAESDMAGGTVDRLCMAGGRTVAAAIADGAQV